MFRSKPVLPFSLLIIFLTTVEPQCPKTCDLVLGSYNVWPGANLTFISRVSTNSIDEIISYNKDTIPNKDFIGGRINVPFSCDCIDGEFLGHVFPYAVRSGDTYNRIAETYYANLTTAAWLARFNGYEPSRIPDNTVLNVTVNCSCGDAAVSEAYGLFVTYPLGDGDSLESIAAAARVSEDILRRYNPGANFSAGSGDVLLFFPFPDKSGCPGQYMRTRKKSYVLRNLYTHILWVVRLCENFLFLCDLTVGISRYKDTEKFWYKGSMLCVPGQIYVEQLKPGHIRVDSS